jgi:hypothetical protein
MATNLDPEAATLACDGCNAVENLLPTHQGAVALFKANGAASASLCQTGLAARFC